MSTEDMAQVPLGQRVTVRHRLPDGRATDAVGTVTARDATSVTLQTRQGEVRVALEAVIVHRVVRPAPWRIETFLRHAGVAVLDLDSVTGAADSTVPLVEDLAAAGTPVFLLARSAATSTEQLAGHGLDRSTWVLDATDADHDEASVQTYARVHAQVEERLGRSVAPSEVRYTDRRPAHLETARAFGWQGRVFTDPP